MIRGSMAISGLGIRESDLSFRGLFPPRYPSSARSNGRRRGPRRNRSTDTAAYNAVGVAPERNFLIDQQSQIRMMVQVRASWVTSRAFASGNMCTCVHACALSCVRLCLHAGTNPLGHMRRERARGRGDGVR